MGQTLTHGVYLPDEGERNCYSGLAGNWTILDGAVGTVAEHTTALAGKAPAVHTHTKSDITDLFNSANTWSANNTYSANCIIYNSDNSGSVATLKLRNSKAEVLSTGNTSSDQSMTFRDKNDIAISYIKGAVQSSGVALKIGAYAKDSNNNTVNTELQLLAYSNGNKAIFPSATDAYNLGSSSYQWNNVYGKAYYYNGTEFQEKFTTLDTVQTISERKNLKQYWHLMAANLKAGAGETYGRTGYSFIYTDKNDVEMGDVTLYKNSNAARTFVRIRGGDYYNNGVPDAAGTLVYSALLIGTKADSTRMISCVTDAMYPENDNATDLGTSTNRWKTFNGLNPGALSLPNLNYSDSNKWIDLSGNITDETGGSNEYAPALDGWVVIRADNNPTFLRINVHAPRPSARKYVASVTGVAIDGTMIVSVPAPAGSRVYIFFNKGSGSLDSATFITCQGNV